MNKESYDTKLVTEQCFRTHKYLTSFKYVQCSFSQNFKELQSFVRLCTYNYNSKKSYVNIRYLQHIVVTSVVTLCYVCQIIVKNHIKSGIKYNIILVVSVLA